MAITPTAAQLSILELNVAMFGQAAGTTVMAAALPTFVDGNTYAQQLYTTSDAYKALATPEQAFTKVINNLSAGTGVTAADVTALAQGMVAFVDAGLTVGATINLLTVFLYNNAGKLNNVWNNASTQLLNKTTAAAVYTLDQGNAAASTSVIENVTYQVNATLTVYTDIKSASLFEAGQAYTPGGDKFVNTLQDVDILTGTATDGTNTLNATMGNANDNGGTTITPKMINMNVVNAAFVGSGAAGANGPVNALNLEDTTGLTTANITRVAQSVNFAELGNIQSVLTNMSVANSNANQAGTVEFSFGQGVLQNENTAAVNLSNVQVLNLNIGTNTSGIGAAGVANQGYEHLTFNSTGADNTVMNLNLPMDTGVNGDIKITGDKALTVATNVQIANGNLVEAMTHGGGINTTNGRLASVDASGMTAGGITLNLGAGFFSTGKADTSGVVQNVTVTGSKFADTFFLNDTIQAGDSLIGGDGTDTLIAYTGNVAGKVTGVENIDVQLRNANVTLDFANIPDATWVNVRNITSPNLTTFAAVSGDNGADQVATLNNLSVAMGTALNTQHATTGNNGIADTTIFANLASMSGSSDTIGLTINEGVNVDPRYNVTLLAGGATAAAKIENIKLTNSDTESNSVELTNYAQHTGTITLTGGAAGTFLNLDVDTAAVDPRAALEAAYVAAIGTAGEAAALAALNAFIASVTTAATNYATAVATNTGITAALAALVAAENAYNEQGLQARDITGGSADGVGYRDIAALATETRLVAGVIDASAEASNVTIRVSTTAANTDGGQKITMGSGDDVVIFDDITAASPTYTTAGLTFADTVAGGAGNNMLVIDGNGTNVILQKSEWDNVSKFQTLYLAGNGAGNTYFLELDNDMIAANGTNANMITILNKDGSYIDNTAGVGADSRISNTAAVINALDLNAAMHFTYTGEAGSGATADRFVVNDQNTNGGNIIRGGDVNTLVNASGVQVNGVRSNDVLEIRNTTTATTADLANITDVGNIVFNNDQAVVQTLNLTLNNAVLDAMSDSGHTATTTSQETFVITANDGLMRDATGTIIAPVAASSLTVNARSVSGAYGLTINGDALGAVDTISATVNTGGAAQTYALSGGNDTVNLYGLTAGGAGVGQSLAAVVTAGAAGTSVTYTFTSADGLTNQVFNFTGVDAVNLFDANAAALTLNTINFTAGAGATSIIGTNSADNITGLATAMTLNGNGGNDTIAGGAGADTITGGAGADRLTGNGGIDQFMYTATTEFGDVITDFTVGTDVLRYTASLARGTSTNATALATQYVTGATATANKTLFNDTGAFAAGTITTAAIAAASVANGAHGYATGTEVVGEKMLMVVNDGVLSQVYLVTSVTADDMIAANELSLVGTLSAVAGGLVTAAGADFLTV